jgi:hypothetical protein
MAETAAITGLWHLRREKQQETGNKPAMKPSFFTSYTVVNADIDIFAILSVFTTEFRTRYRE